MNTQDYFYYSISRYLKRTSKKLRLSKKFNSAVLASTPPEPAVENAVVEIAQGATYFLCSNKNYCICDFGTQDEARTCSPYYSLPYSRCAQCAHNQDSLVLSLPLCNPLKDFCRLTSARPQSVPVQPTDSFFDPLPLSAYEGVYFESQDDIDFQRSLSFEG